MIYTSTTGIMNVPEKELLQICKDFDTRLKTYGDLAGQQEKHNLLSEIDDTRKALTEAISKIENGQKISREERNQIRLQLKHTEKSVAVELYFPKI